MLPAPVTPWGRVVVELLNDYRWHRWDDIMAEAMPVVPFNHASQTALRQLTYQTRYRTRKPPSERDLTKDEARMQIIVSSGRRRKVGQFIGALRRRGDIEERGTGSTREVRLIPRASNIVAIERGRRTG